MTPDDRTADHIRSVLADLLDHYDVEVRPPDGVNGPRLVIGDDAWPALTERAARSGMTAEQLITTMLTTVVIEEDE
jgi:hypothetical protein